MVNPRVVAPMITSRINSTVTVIVRDHPMVNSWINPEITQRARPQEKPGVNPLV
ncbi:MAG: hypothetical protein Q4D24_05320 [Erysipelotrichaceae bacterium]|nr:hypothetical protein [Erysipelotrichaceae bacterium]